MYDTGPTRAHASLGWETRGSVPARDATRGHTHRGGSRPAARSASGTAWPSRPFRRGDTATVLYEHWDIDGRITPSRSYNAVRESCVNYKFVVSPARCHSSESHSVSSCPSSSSCWLGSSGSISSRAVSPIFVPWRSSSRAVRQTGSLSPPRLKTDASRDGDRWEPRWRRRGSASSHPN